MATRVWLGAAVPVPCVQVITIGGSYSADETITITVNGKSLVLTVGTGQTDLDEILDDLVAMINGDPANGTETRSALGSEVGEFYYITATEDGATELTLTGAADGRPFTAVATEDSGSGTFVAAVPTASTGTGPSMFSNTANWSADTVPVDGDDIVFDHRAAADLLYGLDQHAVTPASITISPGFANRRIGLPDVNRDNSMLPYDEVLDTHLMLGESGDSTNIAVHIDAPSCSRIRLNTGTSQATILVSGTGARELQNVPPFEFLGTHASNEMTVDKGDVGIAMGDGQSATVATLRMNWDNDRNNDAIVHCGDGATLTTITKSGGQLETNSNVTTLTQSAGVTVFKAGRGTAATMTTGTIYGGTVYYESSGTWTTATVVGPGCVDFRNDNRGRTVTNIVFHGAISWYDPEGTVTATNGYDFTQIAPHQAKAWEVPRNKTWTPTTI